VCAQLPPKCSKPPQHPSIRALGSGSIVSQRLRSNKDGWEMDPGLEAAEIEVQSMRDMELGLEAAEIELQSLHDIHKSFSALAGMTATYSALLESHNELYQHMIEYEHMIEFQHMIQAHTGGQGLLDANTLSTINTHIPEALMTLRSAILQLENTDFSICRPDARHLLPILESLAVTQHVARGDAPHAGVLPMPTFGAALLNHLHASDDAGSGCGIQEPVGRSSGSSGSDEIFVYATELPGNGRGSGNCRASCHEISGSASASQFAQRTHHPELSRNPGVTQTMIGPAQEFTFTLHDLLSEEGESISL